MLHVPVISEADPDVYEAVPDVHEDITEMSNSEAMVSKCEALVAEAEALLLVEVADRMMSESNALLSKEEMMHVEDDVLVTHDSDDLLSDYCDFVTGNSRDANAVEKETAVIFKGDEVTLLSPPTTPVLKLQPEETAPMVSTLPTVVSPLESSPTKALRKMGKLVDFALNRELTVVSSGNGQKLSQEFLTAC